MPSYHVEKSIEIDAPAEKIRSALVDFREWPKWSPWLIMERDAKLEFSPKQAEPGANYQWSGDLVGRGGMVLQNFDDQHLDLQLNFIKPFKSRAKVAFDITPLDESCRVTWHMWGNLPFFMFFLTNKMKAWIGMDYDRGLLMLKDYVESGIVLTQVNIGGRSTIDQQHYVGLEGSCAMSDIGSVMTKDFESLCGMFSEKGWSVDAVPFSIYHHMDMVNGVMSFVSAIPVSEPVEVDRPFIVGKLEASPALKVTHIGKYDHLGNGWATAMSVCRYQKMKIKKRPMGIEYYLNDPTEVPEEKLITEILVPLKR